MKNFKELREKSVKGIQTKRYLENPTANEIVQFMKRMKGNITRTVMVKDVLYVFPAMDNTHTSFMETELLMSQVEALEFYNDGNGIGQFSIADNIDMYCSTDIHRKHEIVIEDTIKLLEVEFKLRIVFIEKMFGKMMTWHVEEKHPLYEVFQKQYEYTRTSENTYTFHVDDPDSATNQDIVNVDFDENPELADGFYQGYKLKEISFSLNGTYYGEGMKETSLISVPVMLSTVIDIAMDHSQSSDTDMYFIEPAGKSHYSLYKKIIERVVHRGWKVEFHDQFIVLMRRGH